ncbi:hypothetical protein [Streptomyces sp. CT34]|uniref:hypothetical protein n=1 Tax=Streptomyces sp. CT34 TaxID=1553907 RepID=UPI0005B8B4F7|nr:hypothetical protein [Streptomyces sp. CT34]
MLSTSSQIWSAVGTFFLLAVGTWLGYTGASQQSERDVTVLERTITAQLRLAEQQQALKYRAEHAERAQARMTEAYNVLARWLRELSRTIDEVWAGTVTSKEDEAARSELLLDQWPWETLRIPVDIAWAEIYWSREVRDLLDKFRGTSATFVRDGRAALRLSSENNQLAQDVGREFYAQKDKLHGVLADVRDQARQELLEAGRLDRE